MRKRKINTVIDFAYFEICKKYIQRKEFKLGK